MEETRGTELFTVPIGPQHPALKEPSHFRFTVDGEIVTAAVVRLGYAHRGIEKAAESRNWIRNLYLFERVCGICSHIHATAYCLGVERLAGVEVPPRAQAAYQQALLLAKNLEARLRGRPLRPFVYRDYGSLISLSYSSVGSLMGNLLGTVVIEGFLARLTYLSLYKKHQLALHGIIWVMLATLINLIRLKTEPRLKLH